MVEALLSGGGSWMCLVPKCVTVAVSMCLLPTCVAMAIGCCLSPRVWRWWLDMFGVHACRGGSWKWLVLTCLAGSVGCV